MKTNFPKSPLAFTVSFLLFELALILIIIFLGIRIENLINNRIKGIYVTSLNKENLIFEASNLKYFYEPKPSFVDTWSPYWLGYKVKYTINTDSLNERYDYSTSKSGKTYRIITLGDSFTYGVNVNTSENYSEVLEDILNSRLHCKKIKYFEVLNLGVPAYDIEYETERFIRRGMKYNPDLVIWQVRSGNFERINEYYLPIEKELKKNGVSNQVVLQNNKVIAEAQDRAIKEIEKKYGLEYIFNYQKKALFKLSKVYTGKLVIVGFPIISAELSKYIKEFIKSNSNYYFINKLFDYWSNPSYRLLDGHSSKVGHKEIAEDIFNYLRENISKDCILLDHLRN